MNIIDNEGYNNLDGIGYHGYDWSYDVGIEKQKVEVDLSKMYEYLEDKFDNIKADVDVNLDDTSVPKIIKESIEDNIDKAHISIDLDSEEIKEIVENVKINVPIDDITCAVKQSACEVKCVINKAKNELKEQISTHDTDIKNILSEEKKETKESLDDIFSKLSSIYDKL